MITTGEVELEKARREGGLSEEAGMNGGSRADGRRMRMKRLTAGGVSLAEEEEGGTRERRKRMRKRRMTREERRRGRSGADHTLHIVTVVIILRNIICFISLFVEFSVTAPTFESIIPWSTVLRTCGGPAPGVAPHHPIVLLLPPSRTLGGRSVPNKRVVPPRGGGP